MCVQLCLCDQEVEFSLLPLGLQQLNVHLPLLGNNLILGFLLFLKKKKLPQ